MKCSDIINIIQEDFPLDKACGWDHTGFQAGRMNKEVKTIFISLDPSLDTIKKAMENEADLIITHHPLLFSPVFSVTDTDPVEKSLLSVIENKMCLYSMHTNYDVIRMGKIAEEKLEIIDALPLDEEGIGVIGFLKKPMKLEDVAGLIKEKYELPDVRIYGDIDLQVSRIAVVPGSGKSLIKDAVYFGAQVLITGDIGHHDGLDALDRGIAVIDAGHYGLEYVFINDMAGFLKEKFPEIEIICDEVKIPYHTV